jgi:hypothetical protein
MAAEKLPAGVQQLVNERANAAAYGDTDRVAKLDRALAGLQRSAAAARKADQDDKPGESQVSDARSAPPAGRRPTPRSES